LQARKAVLLFRDQDLELAIQSFLLSLERIHAESVISKDEAILFDQALAEYLEHGASTAQKSAHNILEKYLKTIQTHPDYHLMEYLVAASYANIGQFDRFFDHFYSAYQHHSDHYFAYKTKAILHIKLLERARTESERSKQKIEILHNIHLAIDRYPQDHSLYKLLIHFSDPQKLHDTVTKVLQKIIEKNIVVPRSDIAYYVRKGLDVGERGLAKTFVEKAQDWYKYSRALETAQNMLKQEKND
jgi:tetratricopeptide (TPR) repeat protein